ncbi:hypothetical protein BBO99_00004402 [Phytophthora kernoviae]|uniref:SCP domain-containing protein n=2 Tax=Phytophthora kernoviae TaxID=325452 RepID=A0A3R7G8Q2_9STRA|nr:hypothetical protein G195_011260 [Phytophthora kernoviae 00238/432]KAG2521889.1 hypothetical protein JM16_004937 [Phytophthora kernoviae]KAG2523460.1 hypothetical protein JM18_005745 [Phytophthora kernoviae]RLN38312.1 hypothetical protein BBI17_004775 [Phytophthora kernoviae]RLN80552.1 hypothetical protein BBO99_00004402 [Phytophthora kernoviae]
MVSTASLLSVTVFAVTGYLPSHVQSHGYVYAPPAEFKGTTTSEWVVQIEPQLKADWESVNGDIELIALYVEKAKEAGYENNIRKLLDSDTNLYGANCGFTDPDADPKDPPTDGTATFSRGIGHHGPCEIWLDDTMVLHNDDCEEAFGTSDYETIKSVMKPVDYSSCSSSGCMLRFYWLAFQGSKTGKYVWQIYRPAEGQTSTATQGSSNSTETTESTPTATDAPATTATTSEASDTETPATDAPEATEVPLTGTQQSPATPSATEKCNARKRM